MADINKIQMKILKDLYLRDVDKDPSIQIQPHAYELEEKDTIMKIRELVYYIEKLSNLDFIETKDNFYMTSDSVSMEYLNNAVEINDARINISSLGIEYLEALKKSTLNRFYDRLKASFNQAFMDHPYRLAMSHILAFGFGMLMMWLVMTYL